MCDKDLNYICQNPGGLAHLARALAWQARGDRFESDILHKIKKAIANQAIAFLFYMNFLFIILAMEHQPQLHIYVRLGRVADSFREQLLREHLK